MRLFGVNIVLNFKLRGCRVIVFVEGSVMVEEFVLSVVLEELVEFEEVILVEDVVVESIESFEVFVKKF